MVAVLDGFFRRATFVDRGGPLAPRVGRRDGTVDLGHRPSFPFQRGGLVGWRTCRDRPALAVAIDAGDDRNDCHLFGDVGLVVVGRCGDLPTARVAGRLAARPGVEHGDSGGSVGGDLSVPADVFGLGGADRRVNRGRRSGVSDSSRRVGHDLRRRAGGSGRILDDAKLGGCRRTGLGDHPRRLHVVAGQQRILLSLPSLWSKRREGPFRRRCHGSAGVDAVTLGPGGLFRPVRSTPPSPAGESEHASLLDVGFLGSV